MEIAVNAVMSIVNANNAAMLIPAPFVQLDIALLHANLAQQAITNPTLVLSPALPALPQCHTAQIALLIRYALPARLVISEILVMAAILAITNPIPIPLHASSVLLRYRTVMLALVVYYVHLVELAIRAHCVILAQVLGTLLQLRVYLLVLPALLIVIFAIIQILVPLVFRHLLDQLVQHAKQDTIMPAMPVQHVEI